MNYPVICLKPQDPNVYWFENEDSLKTADRQLTLNGVFNNVLIIDSIGKCYLVKKVEIIGWATPFWGFSMKKSGRSVKIKFDLKDDGVISLDQLRSKLVDKIKSLDLTKEEVETGFTNASTIIELINFFK